MCAYCDCVLLIKMTYSVNWIKVKEKRAKYSSLSCPDLAGSRCKTMLGHLELGLFCLVMLSMFHSMLLHRRLGRCIIEMFFSAPAAETDFT